MYVQIKIDVPAADADRIEVVASGLPFWHGVQLALDAAAAALRKRTQILCCRLVVVGVGIGSRFAAEAAR